MTRKTTRLSILIATLTITIVGGAMIGSSQEKSARVETSSQSGLNTRPASLRLRENRAEKPDNPGPQSIPDDVIFRQIFKHVEELGKKAKKNEARQENKAAKFRGIYKKLARLNEKQSKTLNRIAVKTNRELLKLDRRAKQIVDRIRSETPNRRIEFGQKIPTPSQELIDLGKQRKDLTLKAIGELQEEFGMPGYVRFRSFLNKRVKPGIRRIGKGSVIRKGGQRR